MGAQVGIIEHLIRRLEGELSSLFHGVAGVYGEVKDDLFQTQGVYLHRPEVVGKSGVDGYVLSYRALEQAVHVGDSGIQVDYLRAEGLLAGEGKKLAGKSAGPHRRRSDHFQLLASALMFGPLVLEKKLQLAADDGEKIVKVMSYSPGKLTHRLQLLGLVQLVLAFSKLGLCLLPLSQIPNQHIGRGVRLRLHGNQGDFHIRFGPIGTDHLCFHGRRVTPFAINERISQERSSDSLRTKSVIERPTISSGE